MGTPGAVHSEVGRQPFGAGARPPELPQPPSDLAPERLIPLYTDLYTEFGAYG